MRGRSLILFAVVALAAFASVSALSQTPADPTGKAGGGTGALQGIYSDDHPIAAPPRLPDVPPLLPGSPAPGLPHYAAPTIAPGQFAPARNPGPVTGYGPGGMAPLPGAPANPPYSSGPFR